MGVPTTRADGEAALGATRRGRPVRGLPDPAPAVVDCLADSFQLLDGEPQWLVALLADDLARIIADD